MSKINDKNLKLYNKLYIFRKYNIKILKYYSILTKLPPLCKILLKVLNQNFVTDLDGLHRCF